MFKGNNREKKQSTTKLITTLFGITNAGHFMLLKIENSLNLQAGGDLPFSIAVIRDGFHPLIEWDPSSQAK